MATLILKKGTHTVTFVSNDNDDTAPVRVTDSDDNLACNTPVKQARDYYRRLAEGGYKLPDGSSPLLKKQDKPKPAPSVAAATTNRTAAAVHANESSRARFNVGVDHMEVRVNKLKATVEDTKDREYVNFIYDIPTTKNTDCPNPSGKLWRHGFRLNLSCWVLPKERMEHNDIKALIAHWDAHGINHHTIEFATHQTDKVRQIAEQKLDEELRRIHTSLIECIDAADKALADAQKAAEEAEAQGSTEANADTKTNQNTVARRDQKVRSRLRKAIEEFENALHCAELFDRSEQLADLFNGVRSAIRAQREAFNESMRAKRMMQLAEAV